MTIDQVTEAVTRFVPAAGGVLAEALQRLPQKYYDPSSGELGSFVPGLLAGLAQAEPCCEGCDLRLCEDIELIACDPSPSPGAWLTLPGDSVFEVGALLAALRPRRTAAK